MKINNSNNNNNNNNSSNNHWEEWNDSEILVEIKSFLKKIRCTVTVFFTLLKSFKCFTSLFCYLSNWNDLSFHLNWRMFTHNCPRMCSLQGRNFTSEGHGCSKKRIHALTYKNLSCYVLPPSFEIFSVLPLRHLRKMLTLFYEKVPVLN